MVTVLRSDAFRFVLYSNDHGPPHVHVYDGNGMARILIGSETIRPEVINLARMRDIDARRATRIVEECQDFLNAAWRRIHVI